MCLDRSWPRATSIPVLLFIGVLTLSWPQAGRGQERGLRLEEAIRRCLTRDLRILAGRELINQARADARSAALVPNLELSIGVSMLPLSRRYSVEEPGGPPDLSGELSYPVDWLLFGKRAAAMASAELGVRVAEDDFADLIRQRVAETAQAFYTVLEAQALLDVADQALRTLEHVEAITQKAVASGGRPQVELNRVRLAFWSARREQRSAQAAVVAAQASLRALLGPTTSSAPLVLAGSLDGPITTRPLAVEAAYALAAVQRPDIRALRQKVARAQRDIVVEGRNALPEITPGFGVTHQFQQSIGAPDVTAWGASITVTLPFFDRNQGNRAKACSAAVQSRHELQAGLLELRAETEQAVQSLQTAQQNATTVSQDELALAAQVRDSISKAYAAGGRSLIEMLDAQRSYSEIYGAYITTRADYYRSLYHYHASIGKQVTP